MPRGAPFWPLELILDGVTFYTRLYLRLDNVKIDLGDWHFERLRENHKRDILAQFAIADGRHQQRTNGGKCLLGLDRSSEAGFRQVRVTTMKRDGFGFCA